MTTQRGVLVGAGGFAGVWARSFLPALHDRLEMVGLADIDPVALNTAGEALGLAEGDRYSDVEAMFAATRPDVAFIVVPPLARTPIVRLAAKHGIAVLCEKPMAGTVEQAVEIAGIVRESGIRLAVMQNYRETHRIRALKRALGDGSLGAVNTIHSRFGANYTIETAGGAFRHGIPDAMIYEGSTHHLDMLRHLIGADAAWVQGTQWNQPWSTFETNTCVALLIGMRNGALAHYEMSHIERGHDTGWSREYYRLACEHGTVTLDADHVVRIARIGDDGAESVEEIVPETEGADGHLAAIGLYLDWLEGGPPPATVLDDTLRTLALTFAAVEATRTGARVDVPPTLA